MTTSSDVGQRGKWAEKQVQDWLQARSLASVDFAFHRFPDARAAQGKLSAQPADYFCSWRGVGAFMLEVKETKETSRLPKAKISQYGKLKLFDLAGVYTRVVVYISALNVWCCLTDHDLFSFEMCPASFKLSTQRFHTVDEVMSCVFGPIRKTSV